MFRRCVSLVLILFFQPTMTLSQERNKLDAVIKLMRTLCVSGEAIRIEGDGSGGFSILQRGLGGQIQFSKEEVPAFAQGIQSEFMHEEAQNVRECMQPHIPRILDIVFGLSGGTARPTATFEIMPESRGSGKSAPRDALREVLLRLPDEFYTIQIADLQPASRYDTSKAERVYGSDFLDTLYMATLDVKLNDKYLDDLFEAIKPMFDRTADTVDWSATFYNNKTKTKLFGLTNRNIMQAAMLEVGGYVSKPTSDWLSGVLSVAVGAGLGCESRLLVKLMLSNENGKLLWATIVPLLGFDPDEYQKSDRPKVYGIPAIAYKQTDILQELPGHNYIYRSWLPYKSSKGGCHQNLTVFSKDTSIRMIIPVTAPESVWAAATESSARAEFSPEQRRWWEKALNQD